MPRKVAPSKSTEQQWPADKVERRPLNTLIPYASNARTHSDEQVAQIAASMREWGWTNPVLVDEGMDERYDPEADGIGCYHDWAAHKREELAKSA